MTPLAHTTSCGKVEICGDVDAHEDLKKTEEGNVQVLFITLTERDKSKNPEIFAFQGQPGIESLTSDENGKINGQKGTFSCNNTLPVEVNVTA